MTRAEVLAAVLAEHTPACSGPYERPVNGRSCGPIYCVECSAEASEWVTWDPEHVEGAVVQDAVDGRANDCTHMSATGVDTTSPTDPNKVWACDHCGLRWRQDGHGVRVAALAAQEGERGGAEVAAAVEAVRTLAESWVGFDDSHRYGDAILTTLADPGDHQNSSPAGLPAPTMDPSERANGGTTVASRTGTGPAGEVQTAALIIEALAAEAESWPDDEADSGGAVADWLRSRAALADTAGALAKVKAEVWEDGYLAALDGKHQQDDNPNRADRIEARP